VPIVVKKGRNRGEIDLYSTHEEADIRLAKHALWACKTEDVQVCVISDDTYVFAFFVLPLPKVWFLSSFDDAIISLWQSLS